MIGLKFALSR